MSYALDFKDELNAYKEETVKMKKGHAGTSKSELVEKVARDLGKEVIRVGVKKGVEALNTFEKDELLRWFLHWMPMDRRGELMQRYPQHYNKLIGQELMSVTNTAHEED